MITQIVLASVMLAALFILFLVLSKTAGNIDNHLYKLEYLLRKECDVKLEALETKYKIRDADKKFNEAYEAKQAAEEARKAEEAARETEKGNG